MAYRITSNVVKVVLGPSLEPICHNVSSGYRPGRSALNAVELVRRRSWQYDWVVDFDIKGLFGKIVREPLLRELKKYCQIPWVLSYVKRMSENRIQDLIVIYYDAGSFNLLKNKSFIIHKVLFGGKVIPVIVAETKTQDIDSEVN